MKTLREVINGWIEIVNERQGKLSQDMEWSYRIIYYYLLIYRARFLYERKQKKVPHSRWNIQTIPCISLQEVDRNECPCLPPSGCIWMKSIFPVPRPIYGNYISVTSVLGNKTYEYIRWESFEDILNSRFKAEREKPYHTFKNYGSELHLYILSDSDKETVTATLIPEDPLEVLAYPNCGVQTHICTPLDQEFVIDAEALPVIYEMMFEKLIRVRAIAPPELFNNEQPDSAKKI